MNEEEIVKKISKNEDDSILFRIKNGYGKLRQCSLKKEKRVVLLDDVPLVTLSKECSPMSSSIIKLIQGRSSVDKNIKDLFNINIPMKSLEDNFRSLTPLLRLLEDGEYELSEEDMIPTDGENNFFWNLATRSNYYHASADVYYNGTYIKGVPKFLVPSEGIECYNKKIVNYYREKIRNGEKLLGVALELRGFMALLLDGHHKATAAYLEGKNLKCLTIKYHNHDVKTSNIEKYDVEKYDVKTNYSKIKIDNPIEVFPNFKAIAVIQKEIDTSNGKIDKLLRFQSNRPIDDLEEVLYYLTIYDKKRAKELCFNILEKDEFQILWTECLNYLSSYNDYYTQNFFRRIKKDNKIRISKNFEKNTMIIDKFLKTCIS